MYCQYHYDQGTDPNAILPDLIAVLTGETNVTNLTACNQANTTITATTPAGWTLVDDATGTANQYILSAPHVDNPSNLKYAAVEMPRTGSVNNYYGYLRLFAYESWDATEHSGTNRAGEENGYYQMLSQPHGGIVHLWASERFILVVCEYDGRWGDISYGGVNGIIECSRIIPWNNTDYPSFASVNFGACFSPSYTDFVFMTKIQTFTGTTQTGTGAKLRLGSVGVGYNGFNNSSHFPAGPNQRIPVGDDNHTPFFPLFFYRPEVIGMPMGDISSVADIHLAPLNLMGHLETVTHNDNEYIAIRTYGSPTSDSGYRLLVPTG